MSLLMLIPSQKLKLRFSKGAVNAANGLKKPNGGDDDPADGDKKDSGGNDPGSLYDAD